MKGKKRDDAALHYWIGATQSATIAGNSRLGEYLGRLAVIMISIRGYAAIAKDEEGVEQPA